MKHRHKRNILFITGTDTGVGKTEVALLLVSGLAACGVKLLVIKPVETGCTTENGELIAKDAVRLAEVSGQSLSESVAYRFKAPLAPYLAAKLEGTEIDLGKLQTQIETAAEQAQLVIVEGAGGLLVPFSAAETFADLVQHCAGSVLVVVGSKLGALNHAALTFEALSQREIPVIGYVLNDFLNHPEQFKCLAGEDQQPAIATNRKLLSEIAARYGVNELSFVPYGAILGGENGLAVGVGRKLAEGVSEYFALG